MPTASMLELENSPSELASWALASTYYWDPTPEMQSGEVPTSPTCVVLQYDPRYPADTRDVSSTVLAAGSPTVGTGSHASQVQVGVRAAVLVPGYEYRFDLTTMGSLGTACARFFRLICKY